MTDSLAGHILRLKPRATELEIWAHDARWDVKGFQIGGIAVLPEGSVYANIFEGDGLYRVEVKPYVPLKYLFDPKLKTQKPFPFMAYAVKLPQ